MTFINNSNKGSGDDDSRLEPTRDEEQGEASEPDAPTDGQESAGLNTILDGGLGTGVQTDADDK